MKLAWRSAMRLNNLIYRTSKLDAQHVAQTFIWREEGRKSGVSSKVWKRKKNIYNRARELER